MAHYTGFGKDARDWLSDNEKGYDWLAKEVTRKTGLYCDHAYLSKIFIGLRRPPKIVAAIAEICEITEQRGG